MQKILQSVNSSKCRITTLPLPDWLYPLPLMDVL